MAKYNEEVVATYYSTQGAGAGFNFVSRSLTSTSDAKVAGDRFVWYNPDKTARLWTLEKGDLLTVTADGKVGIGTTTPSEKLEVQGNIKVTGTLFVASSRELKENIASLSGQEAIQTLKNLNPVKFNYKADGEKNLHLGFIAEDVPDLVATSDRTALSPIDIVAVLTKAMQEQQKTIAALTEKVKMLEAQTA